MTSRYRTDFLHVSVSFGPVSTLCVSRSTRTLNAMHLALINSESKDYRATKKTYRNYATNTCKPPTKRTTMVIYKDQCQKKKKNSDPQFAKEYTAAKNRQKIEESLEVGPSIHPAYDIFLKWRAQKEEEQFKHAFKQWCDELKKKDRASLYPR